MTDVPGKPGIETHRGATLCCLHAGTISFAMSSGMVEQTQSFRALAARESLSLACPRESDQREGHP
ncbi:MAG TPA: hypothetical protein VLZ55_05045, partial [Rhodanobacter sp.]|nr:hypothetical protein [Rhodanobacter sp.]